MTKLFKEYLKNGISTGDNLLGFKIDIESFLEMSDVFENVIVTETKETDCLIVTKCTFPCSVTTDHIAKELENIWMNSLRYKEFEKHICKINENTVILYFCTTSNSLGVTGKIEAKCT